MATPSCPARRGPAWGCTGPHCPTGHASGSPPPGCPLQALGPHRGHRVLCAPHPLGACAPQRGPRSAHLHPGQRTMRPGGACLRRQAAQGAVHRGRPGPACLRHRDTAPGPCGVRWEGQQRPCSLGWLVSAGVGGQLLFWQGPFPQATLLTGGSAMSLQSPKAPVPRSPPCTQLLVWPAAQQPGQEGDTSGAGPRAGSPEIS